MSKTLTLILSVVLIFLIGSCKNKQIPIEIINLNKAQGLRSYSNIYSLPKTVIRVYVTVERETCAKGPYYQYAQTYLGLSDVIQEDKYKSRISEVEFKTYPISDTNNVFLIQAIKHEQLMQFCINKDGFIESINEVQENLITNFVHPEGKEVCSLNKILSEANKEMQANNSISFDDVSIPKDILSKRVVSEQASALANKILVLRDDRAALLVGDGYTQALPVGETMRTMISEIDKTLESYESMFKGKIVKETFTYSFDYIPEEPRKRTQAILFRFSEQNGVVDNSDINGLPVVIEIESYESLKQLEQFKKRQSYLTNVSNKKEIESGFYYRIPEMVNVRLIKNDKILFEDKMQIAQLGSIQNLPFKYLGGDYTIRFYPELGSLKSISLNKTSFTTKKDKNKK
jgi:hypothetical protein